MDAVGRTAVVLPGSHAHLNALLGHGSTSSTVLSKSSGLYSPEHRTTPGTTLRQPRRSIGLMRKALLRASLPLSKPEPANGMCRIEAASLVPKLVQFPGVGLDLIRAARKRASLCWRPLLFLHVFSGNFSQRAYYDTQIAHGSRQEQTVDECALRNRHASPKNSFTIRDTRLYNIYSAFNRDRYPTLCWKKCVLCTECPPTVTAWRVLPRHQLARVRAIRCVEKSNDGTSIATRGADGQTIVTT
jgi:hypothetical protein